jgi:hypothetical protein
VISNSNYQQQRLCQFFQTAIINSSVAVSDPKQKTSVAELLSVIPNSNYQQQS